MAGQGFAAQELHHDVRAPLGVHLAIEDLHDAGVVDQRGRPGLGEEPFQQVGASDELLQQHLDGRLPVQVAVLGQIDRAHSPLTELVEDAIATDGFSDHALAPPDRVTCDGNAPASDACTCGSPWQPHCTAPASALAQTQPAADGSATDAAARARDHASKGRRLYDLRRYDPAIREFEQAYQLDNDPAHLYNIAQSHRLANHVPEAIAAYRAYLDCLPDAPNRPDVERRIAELGASQRPPNGLDPQPPANVRTAASPAARGPTGQLAAAADHAARPRRRRSAAGRSGRRRRRIAPGRHTTTRRAMPAVAAVVPPPGHHSHDGFFLRMQLGFGFTSVTLGSDAIPR